MLYFHRLNYIMLFSHGFYYNTIGINGCYYILIAIFSFLFYIMYAIFLQLLFYITVPYTLDLYLYQIYLHGMVFGTGYSADSTPNSEYISRTTVDGPKITSLKSFGDVLGSPMVSNSSIRWLKQKRVRIFP